MHRGAQIASGEWLLFTDGDILFAPQTMRLAISYVQHHRVDHLCLNPGLIPGGYWENAMTTCFGMLFMAAFKAWLIPTRWKGAYCGIGAFNLVRAAVYRDVGGFQRLRLDVLDDVNLGWLIKRAGYRQQLLAGDDLIRVRWQNSFWGVIRGLEKNSFAALHYSVGELVWSTLLLAVIFFRALRGKLSFLATSGRPQGIFEAQIAFDAYHLWISGCSIGRWSVGRTRLARVVLHVYLCALAVGPDDVAARRRALARHVLSAASPALPVSSGKVRLLVTCYAVNCPAQDCHRNVPHRTTRSRSIRTPTMPPRDEH